MAVNGISQFVSNLFTNLAGFYNQVASSLKNGRIQKFNLFAQDHKYTLNMLKFSGQLNRYPMLKNVATMLLTTNIFGLCTLAFSGPNKIMSNFFSGYNLTNPSSFDKMQFDSYVARGESIEWMKDALAQNIMVEKSPKAKLENAEYLRKLENEVTPPYQKNILDMEKQKVKAERELKDLKARGASPAQINAKQAEVGYYRRAVQNGINSMSPEQFSQMVAQRREYLMSKAEVEAANPGLLIRSKAERDDFELDLQVMEELNLQNNKDPMQTPSKGLNGNLTNTVLKRQFASYSTEELHDYYNEKVAMEKWDNFKKSQVGQMYGCEYDQDEADRNTAYREYAEEDLKVRYASQGRSFP